MRDPVPMAAFRPERREEAFSSGVTTPGGLGPAVTPPGVPGTIDDTYTPPPSGDLEPFHEL